MASAGDLHALLAAIKRSPIVIAQWTVRIFCARDWARIRKSPDVDAFVLAWIASHARARTRRRTFLM